MESSQLMMLAPAIVVVIAIAVLMAVLMVMRQKQDEQERKAELERMAEEAAETQESRALPARRGRGGIRSRRGGGMRNRPGGPPPMALRQQPEREEEAVEREVTREVEVQHTPDSDIDEDESNAQEEEVAAEEAEDSAPKGKYKKKKEANKEAKRERAAAQQAAIQAQKERQEAEYDRRRIADEEREARDREEEEEEKRRQEEKEQKEQEEFDKWKSSFVVESAGSGASELDKESSGLLAEFLEYIKSHKVIVLEELASYFNLRTEEVIKRVNALESDGTIAGVFDDRGKFIYIEESEMAAVANFINRRGRISIVDLSREAGKLINLTAG